MSQVNDKAKATRQSRRQAAKRELHGAAQKNARDGGGASPQDSPVQVPGGSGSAKVQDTAGLAVLVDEETSYLEELDQLRNALLSMGGKVEAAICDSVQSVIRRDSSLANGVRHADRKINRLELEIDERCHRLLLARRPSADQLRFITTALKIVVDLERIGDLAVNIALRALELNEEPPLKAFFDLVQLADLGQEQLREALDAFVDGDAGKAEAVLQKDDEIDALYSRMNEEFVSLTLSDSAKARRAMSLMFIAKQLERVGDHATNIAEMVIYRVQGVDIRHRHQDG